MKKEYLDLLRRNPGAVSKKYVLAFEDVKKNLQERVDGFKEKAKEVRNKISE